MTIPNKTVFRRVGLVALLLLGFVSAPVGAATPAQRAARFARFDGFLREAMTVYAKAGARVEPAHARFGYAKADLIDPAVVTGETRHVLERYASYRAMLKTRLAASPAKLAFAAPPGSSAPEDHVRGVGDGRTDATAAIEQALAAGNLWLTPGHTYRVSHPIAVPANRIIASDGTGTIAVVMGAPGFPQLPFDPTADRSHTPNVLQIHDVQQVALRDFRMQTPIAAPGSPQSILHGIDIQNASHVEVAGLEVRGFPRSTGIIRINSASDVTIEDNIIHASYTRLLTRQVTSIEVDEARVRPALRQPTRDSDHIRILDNLFFGLVLDPAVYLDKTLRGGKPLNNETTAIAIGSRESMPTLDVSGNIIADVGQGVDLAVSDGHFSGNVIERASEFALKVGHGSSNNTFDHFTITASGIAAVVIYGLPGETAADNRVTNLRIDHPGAVIGLPGTVSNAILLEVTSGRTDVAAPAGTVSGNQFSNVAITGIPVDGGAAWGPAIDCRWPKATRPGDAKPNRFSGVSPKSIDLRSDAGCAILQ